MPGTSVPLGADDLDARWLSAALAELSGGASVVGVSRTRVGNGMVADSVRLQLVWDRPTRAPSALVAKVPSSHETSRAAAAATRTYEIEAAFYRELASTVAVHRPACYLSEFDPATQGYVVLLEDLAPAEPGDQLAGCTLDQAAATVPELVALHGPRWADDTLLDLSWLERPHPEGALGTSELLRLLFPGFLERYAERLETGVLTVCETLMGGIDGYLTCRPRPWTVAHGDFRLDNLLFGGPRVAVLDWQTVKVGPGLSDVSYFLGSGLLPDDRRAHEEALVRAYHERLGAAGIGLAWTNCWDAYRRYSFDGLLMGIAASMVVGRTDRGDEMFLAMVNRHAHQAADLDAAELLLGFD